MLASTEVTKSEERKVAEEHKLSKALDRKGFTITKQLELCKKIFFSWFSIDPILDIITSEESTNEPQVLWQHKVVQTSTIPGAHTGNHSRFRVLTYSELCDTCDCPPLASSGLL